MKLNTFCCKTTDADLRVSRNADFPVCRIADLPVCKPFENSRTARLTPAWQVGNLRCSRLGSRCYTAAVSPGLHSWAAKLLHPVVATVCAVYLWFSVIAATQAQVMLNTYDASGNIAQRTSSAISPPQIIGQPQLQIVIPGEIASFSVLLADSSGCAYQWLFNGTNLPGQTSDALLILNTATSNQGPYSVVVTNNSGSVTSSVAQLYIDSNGNGLPDLWEMANFGNLNQNAAGDADGDGISNLQEFFDGTNPNSNVSARPRLNVLTDGGGLVAVNPFKLSYDPTDTVTLTATPFAPNSFIGWAGDANTPGNPLALLMNSSKTVQARFLRATPAAGMVGWWRAESNALDIIGTNNGVLINGASFATGKVGQAFSLDGISQSVEIADSATLHPASVTIEGWVQFASAGGIQVLYSKPYGPGVLDSFGVWLENGNLKATMSDTSSFGPFLSIPFSPVIGRWYHIGFTFDNATQVESLYLDGARVSSSVTGRPIAYDSHPLIFGRDIENGNPSFFVDGSIDEVSLYDRALTPAEMNAIAAADFAGKNANQPFFTTPAQLPEAFVGVAYTQQVSTVLGTAPISFALSGGSLPPGLTISSNGIFSGTPTTLGSNTFALIATDATGMSSEEVVFGLVVGIPSSPLRITAWWRAEGNTLDSVGSNHGALSNGVTYTAGEVGQAFNFDGTSGYFIAPDAGLPSGNAPRSVEFWMRYEAGATGNHPPFIYGGQSGSSSFYVIVVGNRLYIGSYGGGDTPGSTIATDGNWHHIALTHDGGTARMYVDGQLDAQVVRTYNTLLSGAFYMGAIGTTGDRFKGQVDELAVYNRALSQAEIVSIYQAGSAGKTITGPYINTPSLPDVVIGQTYSATLTSIFATPPVSYAIVGGALPPGITLSSSSVFSGTATTAGLYSFTVQPTDASNTGPPQGFTIQVFAPIAPPPGLIGWWRGESNTVDELGAHTGILNGNATYAVGRVGTAFKLDGASSFVDLGPWSAGTTWTLETWVNASALPGGRHTIIGSLNNCSDWALVMTDGQLGAAVKQGGCVTFLGSGIYAAVGSWYHLAATSDGLNAWLYVNGVLRGTTPVVPNYIGDASGLRIGSAVYCNCEFFPGIVDEPAVYNRALGSNEIAAIFNAGSAGKTSPGPYFSTQPVLPDAIVGQGYTQAIATVRGTAPVNYSITGGSLPGGLALSSSGSITGLPNTAGPFTFVIRATDGASLFAEQTFSIQSRSQVPPPAGIVGWWRGENDALDSIGANDGFLLNGTGFAAGMVGQAFSFDGLNDGVEIEDVPELRPASLTLEAWVMFFSSGGLQHVFAKPVGGGGADSYVIWLENGNLRGMICDAAGGNNFLSIPFSPLSGRWYHVAFTFDDVSKQQWLYLNGNAVATGPSYRSIGYDNHPLLLGADVENGVQTFVLSGRIDEAAIYNRALNAPEIAAIYNAGAAGKAAVGPYINTPPVLPDGGVGQAYTQAVASVHGTLPLTYSLVGGALPPGITLSSGGLLRGIPASEGTFNFVVRVTDAAALFADQSFTLQIDPPVDAPAGIVSLWRAENNALDSVGANHGFLTNGVGFDSGKVGSAFALDGFNDYIQVPDSPSLRPPSITLEGWFLFNAANGIRVLCAKPLGSGNLDSYGIWLENGVLKAAICDNGGFGVVLGTPFSPSFGHWYHIAYTFDDASKQQVLYVDRVTVALGLGDRSIAYDTKPLLLGADIESGNRAFFFPGRIDELALYNRALTAQEVASIYAAGPAGKRLIPQILLQPSLQGQRISISFDATVGRSYTVQSAPSLTNGWVDVTNITAGATNVIFSDFITNSPQRLYRVRTSL